jgi:hypothetical protein
LIIGESALFNWPEIVYSPQIGKDVGFVNLYW